MEHRMMYPDRPAGQGILSSESLRITELTACDAPVGAVSTATAQ